MYVKIANFYLWTYAVQMSKCAKDHIVKVFLPTPCDIGDVDHKALKFPLDLSLH